MSHYSYAWLLVRPFVGCAIALLDTDSTSDHLPRRHPCSCTNSAFRLRVFSAPLSGLLASLLFELALSKYFEVRKRLLHNGYGCLLLLERRGGLCHHLRRRLAEETRATQALLKPYWISPLVGPSVRVHRIRGRWQDR
jgi:hypothetical protein